MEEIDIDFSSKYPLHTVGFYPYFSRMKEVLDAIEPTREVFIDWFEDQDKGAEYDIINRGKSWFGTPVPKSVKEIQERTTFQKMDLYDSMKKRIIEAFNASYKEVNSKINTDIPKWKYNAMDIGTFDFDRAAINLLPRYQYYNTVTKKIITHEDIENISVDKSKADYVQRNTNQKVIIVPILKEPYDEDIAHDAFMEIAEGKPYQEVLKRYGLKVGKYYSTVKNVYRYKDKVIIPKKAVRLFITVGGGYRIQGNDLIYTGITGLVLAELLEQKGYMVNIQAVFGYSDENLKFEGKENQEGYRIIMTTVKGFNETIESRTLLYMLSDPTFFRYHVFKYFQLLREKYQDGFSGKIGDMVSKIQIINAVYKQFAVRDKHYLPNKNGNIVENKNTEFVYHFIDNVFSEQACLEAIREALKKVETINQIARDQLSEIHL